MMDADRVDALRRYADRVQSFQDQIPQWKEEEVKGFLIESLLDALGWDTRNPQLVNRGRAVTMGTDTKRADYVLMFGEVCVCVVEAKAGEVDESAVRQALSYARALDASWALVTNGQRILFCGVKSLPYQDAPMDITISPHTIDAALIPLGYLAKGFLDSEEASDILNKIGLRDALLVFLRNEKDALVKAVGEWLQSRWNRGSVDETLLASCLESLFGGARETGVEPADVEVVPTRLEDTTAGDWRHVPHVAKGVFVHKNYPEKKIDVRLPGPEVERQLRKQGLSFTTPGARGGFLWSLKRKAGLR